jgi:hypothetical protein
VTTKTYTWQDLERELCSRSLIDFLPNVWIPDASPTGIGRVQFQLWPHIIELHEKVEALGPGESLTHLKARQIGITTYFEARFVWQGMYRPGSFMPVISQGELEAKKVISDCRFIWQHLPTHLQVPISADNAERLGFENGGTIHGFPATTKAGRGTAGTEVLMDEADMHPNFGASYDTLMPLIRDTGGRLFAVSTPNPELVDSDFRQLYRKSSNKFYLGYYARPGRSDEGYEKGLEQSSEKSRYEKENSRSEDEALAPPTVNMYFKRSVLIAMRDDEKEPKETGKGGLILIWKQPMVARKYIAFGDVAWGDKGAYSCVTISDWTTMEQVAEIYGRPGLDELAEVTAGLCKVYNSAYTGIEANGEGIQVINKMIELGYGHRMYHHGKDWRNNEKHRGWYTTGGEAGTRRVMLSELQALVDASQLVVRCRKGIDELMTTVRDEKGKVGPSPGSYADHTMSLAGLVQMRKHARYSDPIDGPILVRKRGW